jgi:hypothetical protein
VTIAGQLAARLLEPGFIAVDGGHMRASLREIDRDRAPDAAASARHHTDAACQSKPIR